ncbi:MAG: glycosyltransferase [Alphaproteobacteria bacterium]|nr:glycosyltransferase [Alphaproteobacteria bacterium]
MTAISVITVCLNAGATIERTIRSVRAQTGVSIEHILIDGGSTDATMDIVAHYRDGFATVVSERDRGLYDAMNKGLALARGDFTGFLNADDAFAGPGVLASLAAAAARIGGDAAIGDVLQVDALDRPARMIRGDRVPARKLHRGIAPPHPAFYARTDALRAAGGFDTSYRRAADFDLMARLILAPGFRAAYRPGTVTHMRLGGLSTQGLRASHAASAEILRSCRTNGIRATTWTVLSRYPQKAREVVHGRLMRLRGVRADSAWATPGC